MKDDLKLTYINKKEEFEILSNLYLNEDINKYFGGYRIDRILASEFSFLIYLKSVPIGFILLVREKNNMNFLAVDMALLKEYRFKGYGSKALYLFKKLYLKQISSSLIIETNQNNTIIGKMLKNLDVEYLKSNGNSKVYLIKRN